MRSRSSNLSGSITTIPIHLTVGSTDSYINPVETVTINGETVKVGSLSHKRLLQTT